jgi:hypothetical protein
MATTTKIAVTACDNEAYIIVSGFGGTSGPNAVGSAEICHIQWGGGGGPVNTTIVPQSILPKGNYTLILILINWGGPSALVVTLTTGGVPKIFTAPTNLPVGGVWSATETITV